MTVGAPATQESRGAVRPRSAGVAALSSSKWLQNSGAVFFFHLDKVRRLAFFGRRCSLSLLAPFVFCPRHCSMEVSMPLSRLQPVGPMLKRIVIPDEVALEALGLNFRNFSDAVVMINYSPYRVTIAHWNGSVPTPHNAPIGVGRSIERGDIIALDDVGYEYDEDDVARRH